MRRHDASGPGAALDTLSGRGATPRLGPEVLVFTGVVEQLHLDLLDDVALQGRANDQPRRPVRQRGPERNVQPVEREPVPIGAALGHGQSRRVPP
ncbi:hypothetical protein FHR84_001116 [Actinopolyspora biskrensis]|uniref:Uncharacterized protein n=1 Tax=Actinopolyspora biskrensis TaxID=1470178 RepID=A0A852YVP7_9ACTN|nr:hypothetical protein [Actinopolyspora biskrensis]NYH77802.1 hypothetical protein [Actinopolyspora biskrensis]